MFWSNLFLSLFFCFFLWSLWYLLIVALSLAVLSSHLLEGPKFCQIPFKSCVISIISVMVGICSCTHTNSQHHLGRSDACTRIRYSITCLLKNGRVPSWRCVCDPACFNKRLKWLIPFWLAGGQIMFSQSLHDKIIQDKPFANADGWSLTELRQLTMFRLFDGSKRMEWNQRLPEKTFKLFVWR